MITLKTYLCRKRLSAVDFAERSKNAVSVSDGVVSVKLAPVGFNVAQQQVNTKIVSDAANLIDCLPDTPYLKWTRRAISAGDDFAQLEKLITIEGNIPALPCMWEAAYVYGVTLSPADHHLLIILKPDKTGGEIPENKSDVCKIETDFVSRNTQTDIVPGELLQLAWTIKVDGKIYSKPVAGAWFEGPSVTGGKLIERVNDESTNRYIANVIGVDQECLATDWAQYPTGEWVYIFKQEGLEATKCDRQSEYNQSHLESFVFRIAPITVNDFGNAGGKFEKKNYSLSSGGSEFARLFEASLHSGTIVQLYPGDDAAKVKVSKLGPENNEEIEFDRVPIFYHCEGAETISGGGAAFSADDNVLVLNEGGGCSPSPDNLSIIGFTDAVRPCLAYLQLTTLNGMTPSDYTKYTLSITQPIPKFNPLNRSAAKAVMEEYTALVVNAPCDANGVCKLPTGWNKDMDKTQPLHVWVSHPEKIDLYTRDWRGDYPEYAQIFYFGACPLVDSYNRDLPTWQWNPKLEPLSYARHEWVVVGNLDRWNLIKAETTIVDAYDTLPLGHYSDTDTKTLSMEQFQKADGEMVFGKKVSFSEIYQIRRDVSMMGVNFCETMSSGNSSNWNSPVFSTKHIHRKSPSPYANYPPDYNFRVSGSKNREELPEFIRFNGQLVPSSQHTTGHQIPYAHSCGISGGDVAHDPPLWETDTFANAIGCDDSYAQEILCEPEDEEKTVVKPIGIPIHNSISISSSGCFQMVITAPRAGGPQEYPEYQFYQATGSSIIKSAWTDEDGFGCGDLWDVPYTTQRKVEYVKILQDNF